MSDPTLTKTTCPAELVLRFQPGPPGPDNASGEPELLAAHVKCHEVIRETDGEGTVTVVSERMTPAAPLDPAGNGVPAYLATALGADFAGLAAQIQRLTAERDLAIAERDQALSLVQQANAILDAIAQAQAQAQAAQDDPDPGPPDPNPQE